MDDIKEPIDRRAAIRAAQVAAGGSSTEQPSPTPWARYVVLVMGLVVIIIVAAVAGGSTTTSSSTTSSSSSGLCQGARCPPPRDCAENALGCMNCHSALACNGAGAPPTGGKCAWQTAGVFSGSCLPCSGGSFCSGCPSEHACTATQQCAWTARGFGSCDKKAAVMLGEGADGGQKPRKGSSSVALGTALVVAGVVVVALGLATQQGSGT